MTKSSRSFSSKRPKSETKKKKPKFNELGILKRNQDWLASRERKLTAERQKKKAHETDGCTFEPKINKYKNKSKPTKMHTSRSNTSVGGKSNRSYSEIHKKKNTSSSVNASFRSETSRSIKTDQFNILDLSTKEYENNIAKDYSSVPLDPILPTPADTQIFENSEINPKTQTYDSTNSFLNGHTDFIPKMTYTPQETQRVLTRPILAMKPPHFTQKRAPRPHQSNLLATKKSEGILRSKESKKSSKVINISQLQKQISQRSQSVESKRDPIPTQ